jgi:hypothetical protein
VLGTTSPGTTYTSSDHLFGDADARASRAFDGDPSTAWSPNFGNQTGRFVDVALPARTTVDHVDLTVVADGRHSVPTQFTLTVDGNPASTFTIPPLTDGRKPGTTRTVTVPFAPVTGQHFRLTVDAVRPKLTRVAVNRPLVEAPVALAEVGLAGVPTPSTATVVDTGCRSDLLRINDAPVAVRVMGPAADARSGLALLPCDGAVALDRGSTTVEAAKGLDTGIDLDRMVLSSDRAGQPTPPTVLGTPLHESGATARVVDSTPDSYDVKVHTDGKPFWLVLGESSNDGWKATATGAAVGDRQLVNGFANGWLVRPGRAGTITMSLQWTPQRFVWFGIAISIVAILACIALVVVGWRRRRGAAARSAEVLPDAPNAWSPSKYPGGLLTMRALVVLAIAAAVGTALFSRPWIGFVVGVAAVAAARTDGGRIVLTTGAPVALALARITRFDDLAWLAIGLLALDVLLWWAREHASERDEPGIPARSEGAVVEAAGSSG